VKALRALLVDDNEAFLAFAERRLAGLGTVAVVGLGSDGYQAVRLAEELRPDLIIMDLSMPGMGGLQATRLIKAQDRPPRIIIASFYDDAEHREHAAAAGADGFISKQDFERCIGEQLMQLIGGN
jgi:two-component system invasion response regulator UvrY